MTDGRPLNAVPTHPRRREDVAPLEQAVTEGYYRPPQRPCVCAWLLTCGPSVEVEEGCGVHEEELHPDDKLAARQWCQPQEACGSLQTEDWCPARCRGRSTSPPHTRTSMAVAMLAGRPTYRGEVKYHDVGVLPATPRRCAVPATSQSETSERRESFTRLSVGGGRQRLAPSPAGHDLLHPSITHRHRRISGHTPSYKPFTRTQGTGNGGPWSDCSNQQAGGRPA